MKEQLYYNQKRTKSKREKINARKSKAFSPKYMLAIKTRLSRFSLFFPGFYLSNKLAKNNRVF